MASQLNVQGGIGVALISTLVFGCLFGLPAPMWYILLPSLVGFIAAHFGRHDEPNRKTPPPPATPDAPEFPDRPWQRN